MTLKEEQEELPEGVNFATSEDAVFVFKNYSPKQEEERKAYRARQKMPDWEVKEDMVISGMSGRFPGKYRAFFIYYNISTMTNQSIAI